MDVNFKHIIFFLNLRCARGLANTYKGDMYIVNESVHPLWYTALVLSGNEHNKLLLFFFFRSWRQYYNQSCFIPGVVLYLELFVPERYTHENGKLAVLQMRDKGAIYFVSVVRIYGSHCVFSTDLHYVLVIYCWCMIKKRAELMC